jgi:hypothetical protein
MYHDRVTSCIGTPRTSSPRVINVQWAYWDFVASERSTGVDPTAWSIGTYVKDYNKVFRILVSGLYAPGCAV